MFLYTHFHVPRSVQQCCSPSAGGGLGFHGVSRWQGPLRAKFCLGVDAAGILPFPHVGFGPIHWPSLAGGDHPTRLTGLEAHQGGRCMPSAPDSLEDCGWGFCGCACVRLDS
ncbi:hypothetical protein KSP39_PZI016975 [Platanthera zijinensis]|uniref:Uncharacterized protein n=1 Tax=Platanthera zijinensis TaxID=2320716 RepID=A0AAP0B6Z2_9ASPA